MVHNSKLNKKYVGKNFDDFRIRKLAKEIKLRPSQLIKFMFIEQQASRGNAVASREIKKGRSQYRLDTQSINQRYSSAKNVKDDGK